MEEFIEKYSPHLLEKKLFLPPHDEFVSTYRNQRFSLPPSIIYYIAKNPSTPKTYQKLIQCCKYFFIRNPILVLDYLGLHPEDLPKILYSTTSKLWITNQFCAYKPYQYLFSSILSKIYYKSDIRYLGLYGISLTLKEFSYLSQSADFVTLNNVFIKYSAGDEVELEVIAEFCDCAKFFRYTFPPNPTNISSETVNELVKLPHVSKIETFWLREIPDAFDVKPLIEYAKKTELYVALTFCENLSEDYRNQLEEIMLGIDENADSYFYKPILIIDDYEIEAEIEKALLSRMAQ